ncbi:MAG: SRPBCC family protein [Pseudomonas sp.]|uniref:SRPBCC family protein n=1 Tax=Pseudomonas sp. TaxID=306 RepID=UPI0030F27202
MLSLILIVLVVAVVVLLLVVSRQPDTFRVERSRRIAAPLPVVFAQVNDYHLWQQWSPWAKLDPDMQVTYSGPSSGVGATQSWVGNNQVGQGSSTIVESRPDEFIRMQLRFLKPFQANNEATFTFVPDGESVQVTWAMSGPKNLLMKGMHMVMDVDKLCGQAFEQGLAQLEVQAQQAAARSVS